MSGPRELTLLHMGDLHGHLVPRPHVRRDGTGRLEGGLARLATLVARLRTERPASLLVNTGDTIQGSAEALFTRGQALVDVVDRLGVDLFAPGNWDYLYGKDRFLELFGPGTGRSGVGHRWGALAANVYLGDSDDLLLPPTRVVEVGGLRVGVVALSSERAINALGPWVTQGLRFTADAAEVPGHVAALQAKGVDLVVLISEFGLAKNILIAEQNPQIAVVLSSDMHEETRECVVTSTGALVSEVGQDGTRLARLDLTVDQGRVVAWDYVLHTIDDAIPEDDDVAALVAEIRRPFLSGPAFRQHTNPLNGTVLDRPIDTVVGETRIGLHRSGFSDDERPAVVGGTSHDVLARAIRDAAGADVGHMRGFRYGTHVAPGPVHLEDLFHYMPVGAQVARTQVPGSVLRERLEKSAAGALAPDPFEWTGGWLDTYAGLRFALDPVAGDGERISELQVRRGSQDSWQDLDPDAAYTVSGYWYARTPERVGSVPATTAVEVVDDGGGGPLDAVDVVAAQLAGDVVLATDPGVRLVRPLPPPTGPNPEIQPLRGARPGTAEVPSADTVPGPSRGDG